MVSSHMLDKWVTYLINGVQLYPHNLVCFDNEYFDVEKDTIVCETFHSLIQPINSNSHKFNKFLKDTKGQSSKSKV